MAYKTYNLRPVYPNEMVHSSELYHHGIRGQKWGVRRFQNPDGTLTPAGKKRYEKDFRSHSIGYALRRAPTNRARMKNMTTDDADKLLEKEWAAGEKQARTLVNLQKKYGLSRGQAKKLRKKAWSEAIDKFEKELEKAYEEDDAAEDSSREDAVYEQIEAETQRRLEEMLKKGI